MVITELDSRIKLAEAPGKIMGQFFDTRGEAVYEIFQGMNILQDDDELADDYAQLESIQPFIGSFSKLFRKARVATEEGLRILEQTEGMSGGVRISDTPLEASESLADFLIASGDTNIQSLEFLAGLNDISEVYDEFIAAMLKDRNLRAAAKIIPISAAATRIKGQLNEYDFDEEDAEGNNTRDALSDLVTQLDRNQRIFKVMDSQDIRLEDATFNRKVDLTLKMQQYFLDLESRYRFGETVDSHRRNFGVFMAKFFDSMEGDYNLPGGYESFLRGQERGILASVQSMLFLKDRGFEIKFVDEVQDKEFKIDFIAKKNGVEYVVQAKTATRDKVKRSLDGSLIYVDNKHLQDIIAIDPNTEPIYATRARNIERGSKLEEFIKIHDENVSDNDGWLWMEIDPYMGISEDTLQRTGRVRKAA